MLKKCKQPQAGYVVSKPSTLDPEERILSSVSFRLTGTVPLEQDYQSLVPDTGWGSTPPGGEEARPSLSISGGPESGYLTSRAAHLPQDLEVYAGGIFSTLATGCFYLLLDMASVRFPSSSRSAPSQEVWVCQKAAILLRPGDAALFPLVVDWRRWNRAVLPVLQDDRWFPLIPINNRRVLQERYSEFVALLEGSLLQSFQAAGYLPQGLT